MAKIQLLALALALLAVTSVNGHGRFIKPPNRSSIWRVPEFQHLNPPQNYNDLELYCGAKHQVDDPGTECGVCGDPLSQARPRDNEIGGRYEAGIIVANYQSGQEIDIEVYLSAAHLGNMEWRLCTNPATETQECFNQHVLQLADGRGTKLPVDHGPGTYTTRVRLPQGVRCERCIIQWNYRAGNGWGDCGDGSQGLGCGPQETFRGCSDVKIS